MELSLMLFVVIVLRVGSIVAHGHDQPFEPRSDSRHSLGSRDGAYNTYTDHDTGQNGFTLSRRTRSDGSACERCKCCMYEQCNTETGYCSQNHCNRIDLVPPLCTRVLKPTKFKDIKDTTATALQEVDIPKDIAEYSQVVLQVQGERDEEPTIVTMSRVESGINRSTYEATIARLQPGTWYTVSTRATIGNEIPVGVALRLQDNFRTTGGVKPGAADTSLDVALEIYDLQVRRTTDTAVTLDWKTRPQKVKGGDLYRISIETNQMIGCGKRQVTPPKVIERTSEDETIEIDHLHSYASYTAFVYPGSGERNRETAAQVNFNTSATDVPTSVVSNLRYHAQENILRWEEPQDCTTITGPIWGTRLFFYRAGSNEELPVTAQTALTFINLSNLTLHANTEYHVRAHVIRNSKTYKHSDKYEGTIFRTRLAAPSHVTKLRIVRVDSDTSTIVLQWEPPETGANDIEYYKVVISRNGKPLQNDFKIEKEKRECNVTLPLNLGKNDTAFWVYAVNKVYSQTGGPTIISFEPGLKFTDPSKPLNLTHDFGNHGIVILKWNHPSISYNPIKQFDIQIHVLETKLLDQRAKKFPIITVTYPVIERQPNYHKRLYLLTSTSYQISVTALNSIHGRSSQGQVNISVPAGYAFGNGGKLGSTPNGTSFDVKVPGVKNATENTRVIIYVKGFTKCPTTQPSSQQSGPKEWVAHEYQLETNKSKTSTIDPDHGAGNDCVLQRKMPYDIKAALKNESGSLVLTSSSLTISPDEERNNKAWLIIFPIIIIIVCVIIAYVWYRKRKTTDVTVTYADVNKPSRSNAYANLRISCSRQSSTPPVSAVYDNAANRISAHVYAVPFVSESNAVSTKCFEAYAKEAAFNGVLYSQYATLPKGLIRPCDYGRLPENMPKNRNEHVIAYDDTRVKLDKIPGVPYSDYINASYIQGYGEKEAYIATQAPKPNTVNDFWRMIWQKGVKVICMLTNLIEDGKEMCEQYWPEVGYEYTYGEIKVTTKDHAVFADYTIRSFELNYKKETRKVNHLHYTGWPDRDIPMYSQSLVIYLKKLVEILDGRGPVVIHCSAGDGRTGTIILCDMCVRQGIVEGEIDVSSVVQGICNSRANMMCSPQQYVLAHIVISESMKSTPTQIPCTEILPTRIKALRKQLPSQMQRLSDTTWQERALRSFASGTVPEFEPVCYNMIENECYSTLDSVSNYIGGVPVDGVRIKNQFLASKLPSTTDLPNFWKRFAEKNIELVIVLQKPKPNDTMFCDFMPGQAILVPLPYIQVEVKSSETEIGLLTIDRLSLTDISEETARSQPVTVLTCNGWESDEKGKPPDVATLVWLWQTSEKIPRKKGPTLVLCRDGVTACGLYLALSFLLERMAVERECDVISAVRAVRRSRPEFVQKLEQFEYLYDAAINYANCFETYANFS